VFSWQWQRLRRCLTIAGAAAALAGVAGVPTGWAASPGVLYVSASGSPGAADTSCATAAYDAISAAIAAAAPGATVVVCPGTYDTSVVVMKPLTLTGHGATIDATGHDVGITVVASGATVEGFTVTGATGEGILVVGKPGQPVRDVTVSDNLVVGNDRGNPTGGPISDASYRECNAVGQVPGDCGEGIHLMVAEHAIVRGNEVVGNAGGILLTDEFGPTDHNLVENNVVVGNVLDCGITLASHSPAGFAHGQRHPQAGGVFDNVIRHNFSADNGTVGQGAGILMATPLPGGAVYGNEIADNTVEGNGQAGITVHSHTPGEDLNGNVIVGNTIGVNNLAGDMDFAPHVNKATTGITVATVAPLTITIQGNTVVGDANGVWEVGPVRIAGLGTNVFVHVGTPARRE
jgi:nitrous oxidase accessory protein NosD